MGGIATTGLTALGAEVVWTRLLSLLFGATTYAFSVILAVFLIGLGIGSVVGSAVAMDILYGPPVRARIATNVGALDPQAVDCHGHHLRQTSAERSLAIDS